MAQNVWIKRALLVVLMDIVTIVEVNFVGDITIYSLKVANIREELHKSIVHNHPPAGGWVERGANDAMNIRVVIPYLVEFLPRRDRRSRSFNFIRPLILSVFGLLLSHFLHICANSSPHGRVP